MAEIYIYDDLHPEDNAMLQALYSRSPQSVVDHVEKVKAVGSGKFMEQFYVGYGHASIGDCGSTTIFLENVSMLAAKAFQDHQLYSGQEASTRYLDFAKQPLIDPYAHPESGAIQTGWITLYDSYMPKVKEALRSRHPFNAAEHKTEKMWDKAISARAFDILRCLLPVGTGTLLSWHTNLRQARDHLRRLNHNPLIEVRNLAKTVHAALLEKYPHSFNAEDMDESSERNAARNAYAEAIADEDQVLLPEPLWKGLEAADQQTILDGQILVDMEAYNAKRANQNEVEYFRTRPKGGIVPHRFMQYGLYNLTFLLDFGSFRDLQRHRNGFCPLPLITSQFGFHSWYLNELQNLLSENDFSALKVAIDKQISAVEQLPASLHRNRFSDQYLYPMGMAVLCRLGYSLPQMIYVAELRSGATVHPSLRPIAQKMGQLLNKTHPLLKTYIDNSSDEWSFKRGQQDITAKATDAA